MGFTPKELSEFFVHYSTIGDTIQVDSHRIEEHTMAGHGELYLPNRMLEFTVHLVDDKELTESVCMTEIDDFELFEILIHKNYPGQNFLSDYRSQVEIACIRQLVRIGISSMPDIYKDPSHSTLGLGQMYKLYPVTLDYKPEVQAFFQSRMTVTDAINSAKTYMSTLSDSLLHGGINIREYEVDLESLRFLTRDQLSQLYYSIMGHTGNNAIMREAQNRVHRLSTAEYNGNVIHPEFELRLHLN